MVQGCVQLAAFYVNTLKNCLSLPSLPPSLPPQIATDTDRELGKLLRRMNKARRLHPNPPASMQCQLADFHPTQNFVLDPPLTCPKFACTLTYEPLNVGFRMPQDYWFVSWMKKTKRHRRRIKPQAKETLCRQQDFRVRILPQLTEIHPPLNARTIQRCCSQLALHYFCFFVMLCRVMLCCFGSACFDLV